MSELRLYSNRDSLRDNNDCLWIVRHDDGHIVATGSTLENLPQVRRSHLVLPADLVTILPVRLPDLPPRKLAPLLSGAVEAHVLGQAEQLHVAALGRDEQGLSWLAVVDKGWLQYTLARLAEKGIRVDAALPESLLLPLEDNAWSLLRHEDGTLLRASPTFGLAVDQGNPPAGLLMALDHAEATGSGRPQRLFLYQGRAMDSADLARWHSSCKLPVETRGDWDWREPAWPATINLLQGALQPRHARIDLRLLLRPIVLGVILLATVHLAGMTIDRFMLSAEQRALQTKMRDLAERVLPAHAAVVDPAWQIGAQLKALRAAKGDDSEGMALLLGLAGKLRPPGGNVDLKEIRYESGRLSLDYVQADDEWLKKFVSALSASGLSASVAPSKAGGTTLVIGTVSAPSAKGNSDGR
jgi:general secretion pathway protein L